MILFSACLSIWLLIIGFFIYKRVKNTPIRRIEKLEHDLTCLVVNFTNLHDQVAGLCKTIEYKRKEEDVKYGVYAHQAHLYFKNLEALVKRYDELEQMLVMPGVKVKKKK